MRAAPRLLITIVVDQLAAWEAAERWSQLPADGGFARLRREGLTVPELRFEHAATDTAPGHAALYTGAVPRVSGIFANEVPGPDSKPRSILADEQTRLVGSDGVEIKRPGSSLARLRVDTLADVLVRALPRARVYSFSLKDRAALFGAGRKPTLALWLDVPTEQVVSSTGLPAPTVWAARVGSKEAVTGARAGGWMLADAERGWVEAHAGEPDDQRGEGDLAGLGRAFPHAAIGSAKAMRATPVGDRVLFGLAAAALGEIAADKTAAPALLALSLSSHDYVAHVFGPHSWEAWAELRELDHRLGELLAAADRAVGPDGYAVMLTGDHGGGALPEIDPERRVEAARRFMARRLEFDEAERAAMIEQVLAIIGDGRFGDLFQPGSRAEVPVVGRLKIGDRSVAVSGQLDRLVVSANEVLIADYKTNRPAPGEFQDVPPAYVGQLALYRAVLAKLYPDKPIRAALVFTEIPQLMEVPAQAMDAALSRLPAQ